MRAHEADQGDRRAEPETGFGRHDHDFRNAVLASPASHRVNSAVFCLERVNLPRRCDGDDEDAAGEPASLAAAGQAGRARNLGRRLARWWSSQAPDGRTYHPKAGRRASRRSRAGHSGRVRGACSLRLAVALAVATVLKVSLEDVSKMFMQRDQPAQTLPDVILRGNSAAHGLSLSLRPRHGDLRDHRSGGTHLQRPVEGLALGPGRCGLPVPCIPWRALPVGRRRGVRPGHVHRGRAKPRIRCTGQQPQHRLRERITVSSRARLVETASTVPGLWRLAAATCLKTAIPLWAEARIRLLYRTKEPWPGALPLTRLTGTAIRSGRPCQHRDSGPGRRGRVLPCAG